MSVSRFRPASDGRAVNILHAPKAASQLIDQDELLTQDTSGNLIPAVAASLHILGPSLTKVIATDDNFATTDEIEYDGALEGDEFIMDVDDAGTAGFVAGVTRSILYRSGAETDGLVQKGFDPAAFSIRCESIQRIRHSNPLLNMEFSSLGKGFCYETSA